MARVRQVFLQTPVGLVDAGVQHHLGRAVGQLLGRHLGQQHDRVMIDLAPFDGVEIPEKVDHLRVPAPP
jgi:hypothetical protein